ncbi:glycoside hydrolase family protein [Streptomyces millisiae]|uniref:Glycosyl hydrolase n=1 Tax=Streptomyces millisiae TaxID=3075542 RepID=A0ABU2LH94_9ACTN|nr:glycosyl hydrolase [Streptomyces sp. DSM 44918]MDT0316943.1 glycosyl hydrolase [Streptomyces sp. DSM 44918]
MSHPTAGTPLYTDPVHHAPTDPTLIEAPDGSWRMFYTQRRAGDEGPGVRWVHGTDIGVAGSTDGGRTWDYLGVVDGLDPNPGRNTLWAPEIVHAEGRYHMFLTYIRGVPDSWAGHPRAIRHLVSDDLVSWQDLGAVPLSSDRVIDACVHPLPAGGYRMWFKDEAHDSATWAADSPDLTAWGAAHPVIEAPPHEGPNVFELGGRYWMVTDEWRGLGVHRSTDLSGWERQGLILDTPGRHPLDAGHGHHADVVVGYDADGEEVGWIFYFTHRREPAERRTDVQVATLRVVGDRLRCDRGEPTHLDLRRARRG